MGSRIGKHSWWLFPLLACALGGLGFLSYNFFPSMSTYSLRSVAAGISIVLSVPLFLCFTIAAVICVHKILRKKLFSSLFKFCLVSPAILIVSVFTIGFINELAPIPQLDPHMQINQFSQNIWENDKLQRRPMVGDLVESILPGKKCIEIEYILGDSLDENFSAVSKPFQCHSEKRSELRYFVGSRGFFSDVDNIQVFFDKAGFYSHYKIYTYNW